MGKISGRVNVQRVLIQKHINDIGFVHPVDVYCPFVSGQVNEMFKVALETEHSQGGSLHFTFLIQTSYVSGLARNGMQMTLEIEYDTLGCYIPETDLPSRYAGDAKPGSHSPLASILRLWTRGAAET